MAEVQRFVHFILFWGHSCLSYTGTFVFVFARVSYLDKANTSLSSRPLILY